MSIRLMRKLLLILLLFATACARRGEERREERAEERHEERTEARREERKEERREERREHRRRRRHRPERPPAVPPPAVQPTAAWSGILDPSRAMDWSTAGIPGGIPNITTQCGSTLTPSGDATGVTDLGTIQNAVTACSTAGGGYVQLAAGTFYTAGTLNVPTKVVLRGMGADQTILRMNSTSGATGYALVLGSLTGATAGQPTYSRTMPITSTNSKGDTTITVGSDGSGGSISQLQSQYMVWIAALNDWFPACGGYPATVPSTSNCVNTASDIELGTPGGLSSWNMDGAYGANNYTQRASGQMGLITNVNTATNTITLEEPLVDSFRHPLQDWTANSPADPIHGFNFGMVIRPTSQTAPVPHVYVQTKATSSPAPGYCLTGPTPPVWPTNGPCNPATACSVTEVPTGLVAPNVACQWQDFGPGTDTIPRLMYWVPNVNVGLENLQIFGVNNLQVASFTSLVLVNNCLHCWVRGIEINRPVGFITQTLYSYHGQIEQNYYTTSWYHGSGTDSVIEVSAGTSGFLIQNNIFDRTPEAVFTDHGSSGNVIAYNYSVGNWGANGINNGTNTLLSHDAFPWFNLQEGNIISQIAEDGIHGGNAYGTKFRNWARGTNKICQPVSVTGLTGSVPTRPPVPTVATNAVGGTTTYSYAVELVVGGAQSAPSVNATITNGPATLSSTTYNTITAPNVSNLYTMWNSGSFTSTTPPANGPTQTCLIFRTAGGTAAQISPVGGIPCDGTTVLQDTGQASTGVGITGTGAGQSIIPGVAAICTPLGPNENTAGANAWIGYQGVWPIGYAQLSLRFNDVGNVVGSQDMNAVSQNTSQAERRKACAICNSRCANSSSPIVTCATARSFPWLLDESFGFGGGVGTIGAWDTTLAQDTSFHCRNYYHSLDPVSTGSAQGIEAGDCPSTTVLPPSFYLSSKPAWWGSAHWPPIGPDVSGGLAQSFGYAYNNPAKNCYENVMGGTDSTGAPFLTFNAAACYSGAVPAGGYSGVTGNGKITGQGKIT